MDTWKRGVVSCSQLAKFLKHIQFDSFGENQKFQLFWIEYLKSEDSNNVKAHVTKEMANTSVMYSP